MSTNNYNDQHDQNEQLKQPVPQIVVVQQHQPSLASSTLKTMYNVFHILVSIFAIVLVFNCNRTFDVSTMLSLLAAVCFPYLYILYIFVTRKGFCNVQEIYTTITA
jgi:hypothetical protein